MELQVPSSVLGDIIFKGEIICGDKTWLKSAIGQARSAQLQGHLPSNAWRSRQQTGKIFISKNYLQL